MRRLSIAALALLSACAVESTKYRTNPRNSIKDVRKVAVFPFINQCGQDRVDMEEYARIFSSELVKFGGFEVIRPEIVLRAIGEGERIATVQDALKLGRKIKVDALLIVSVTDLDVYNPPKVALKVMLLRTSARTVSAAEIDRIVQSASWNSGPLPMTRDAAGNFIAAFEEVWDAHSDTVREEVERYAQAQGIDDTAFRDAEEFLAVSSRYMQFVSNQAIRLILEQAAKDARQG